MKYRNLNGEEDEDLKAQMELEDAIRPRWYILSSRSNKRFVWDVIIIIFAIQNGITLPLQIAFDSQISKEEAINDLLDVLNVITVIIFTIDIAAGFLTSYVNVSSGDEIHGAKMVARNYILNGSFMIDILSTFPLDDIYVGVLGGESTNVEKLMKVFGILKMQRIRRISKIIGNMNQTQETKAFFKVAQMVFFLILYIHVLACLLWTTFTFSDEQTWIPEVDFIYVETKIFDDETSFGKKYLSMCYHAIMVFGLNEVAPREEREIVVVFIMMIFSAIANAYIFGEMAVLVQEMDKKDIDF